MHARQRLGFFFLPSLRRPPPWLLHCVCMADNFVERGTPRLQGQVAVFQLFRRKMPGAGEAVVFPPAGAGPEWNNHPPRVGPHLGWQAGDALHATVAYEKFISLGP
jgi:hypothetical protein